MAAIAMGGLIGLNHFDITNSYTLIHLFTFVQISLGFLPAVLAFFIDALIAVKRINAFLNLPEIDRSFIDTETAEGDALKITGKHSFAYGLEDDHKVSHELDSSFYMKCDRMKEIRS